MSATRDAAVTIEARASSTTRSGGRPVTPCRTARWGSSTRAAPEPTSTASCAARNRCASTRAARDEIQREVPSGAATRPSSVAPNTHVTRGRARRAIGGAYRPSSASRVPVTAAAAGEAR